MIERELKLHVPDGAHTDIEKTLRAAGGRRVTLNARYYDTASRELAKAGIALRLRKEGRRWVQTLKAPGSDALSRLEFNHIRPEPSLDLWLYDGTPIQEVLRQLAQPLVLRYETRVSRLILQQEMPDGLVEIAYDRGVILAGRHELPIDEVEFELVSGSPKAMFELGEQWLQRYGLVLDLRSKAERGDRLASLAHDTPAPGKTARRLADEVWPARRAREITLKGKMSIADAYQLCANECLAQVVQNAAFAAGVDTARAGKSTHMEYIHQLRVGIRRLRSCWRLFKPWMAPPDPADQEQLKAGFAIFGGSRDADITRLTVEPRIKADGLPEYRRPRRPHEAHADPAAAAAAPGFQQALLHVLRDLVLMNDAAQTAPAPTAEDAAAPTHDMPALRPAMVKRLNRWLKRIAKAGSGFTELAIEAQHDLRKEVKNLRYCVDFLASLLSRSELAPLRTQLSSIQDTLGNLNDDYIAEAYYLPLTDKQPQVWFAVGWLRAMQQHHRAQAQELFRQLRKQGELRD